MPTVHLIAPDDGLYVCIDTPHGSAVVLLWSPLAHQPGRIVHERHKEAWEALRT